MIYSVSSDLPSFKDIDFRSGLNILVSNKHAQSSHTDSRNGSGKSSLLEIIHFLAGGVCDKKSIFKYEQFIEHQFEIVFDVAGEIIVIRRSGSEHNKFLWQIKDKEPEVIGQKELTSRLGSMWFKINPKWSKNSPSFRSIFSYYVRRSAVGGMQKATEQSKMQQLTDKQVNLGYLLGLDWTVSRDLHLAKAHKKDAKALRSAAKSGVLKNLSGDEKVLEADIATLEVRISKQIEEQNNFRVVDQYKDQEDRANKLTKEINHLRTKNVYDADLLDSLSDALEAETPPDAGSLKEVYSLAGVEFPNKVLLRFAKVKEFHEVVLQNRITYLRNEISKINENINNRAQEIKALSDDRASLMQMLKLGGALEHFSLLQNNITQQSGFLEAMRTKLENLKNARKSEKDVDDNIKAQAERVNLDYEERGIFLKSARATFGDISSQLYKKPGRLLIGSDANGLSIDTEIEGDGSAGIGHMQIFCFDWMLAIEGHKRGLGAGFLIHDSQLFDGVDSRQIKNALEFGAKRSKELGIQYIVTMNSDDLFKVSDETGYDAEQYILPRNLDDSETGGLFGMRF